MQAHADAVDYCTDFRNNWRHYRRSIALVTDLEIRVFADEPYMIMTLELDDYSFELAIAFVVGQDLILAQRV